MIKPLSFYSPYILFLLVINGALLSQPQVKLSTTIITPRTSQLQQNELTDWNTVVNYSQMFNQRLSIESQFEYGVETEGYPNPFRLYNLTAKLNLGPHIIRMGRIAHWSRLVNARVDGIDYTLTTPNWGAMRLLGGFNAVTDFSDTSFTENISMLASWSKGRIGNNLDVSYWMDIKGDETFYYAGASLSKNIFFDLRFSGSLAWSVSAGQIYHNKLKISKKLGNNILTTGLRQKRYLADNPYSWVDEAVIPSPVINLGMTSRLGRSLVLWNQLNHRLNEAGVTYFRSSAIIGKYSITAIFGSQGDKTLMGTNIGAKMAITKKLDFAGSLSLNTLSYDDIIEPANSVGGYWSLSWQPLEMVAVRLFVRYFKNPYFNYDSRGGLVIDVAL